MTLWKVTLFYDKDDNVHYEVTPYNFWGHLKCCYKWYGWVGLKRTYLSKRRAEKVAAKLNRKAPKNEQKSRQEQVI